MKPFLLSIFLFSSLIGWGQRVDIVDESYLDSDFLEFRNELLNCVLRKDTIEIQKFFFSCVFEGKDICGGFCCSNEEIMSYFFNETQFSQSFSLLFSQLRFGFRRVIDSTHFGPLRFISTGELVFQSPSFLNEFDSYEELMLIGENVNIRSGPSTDSEVLETSSYSLYRYDWGNSLHIDEEGNNWVEIKLTDSEIGYVLFQLTSLSIDKELTIGRVNGEYKIISWFNIGGC